MKCSGLNTRSRHEDRPAEQIWRHWGDRLWRGVDSRADCEHVIDLWGSCRSTSNAKRFKCRTRTCSEDAINVVFTASISVPSPRRYWLPPTSDSGRTRVWKGSVSDPCSATSRSRVTTVRCQNRVTWRNPSSITFYGISDRVIEGPEGIESAGL
jgi:hypothetical protein